MSYSAKHPVNHWRGVFAGATLVIRNAMLSIPVGSVRSVGGTEVV